MQLSCTLSIAVLYLLQLCVSAPDDMHARRRETRSLYMNDYKCALVMMAV